MSEIKKSCKNKKPLKIKGLTTVIVLKAGLETM
jgi:hypothetical protein